MCARIVVSLDDDDDGGYGRGITWERVNYPLWLFLYATSMGSRLICLFITFALSEAGVGSSCVPCGLTTMLAFSSTV